MNPLRKLVAFRKSAEPPSNKRQGPRTFEWKGVAYDAPSCHTLAMTGFNISSRGRAWEAYKASHAA